MASWMAAEKSWSPTADSLRSAPCFQDPSEWAALALARSSSIKARVSSALAWMWAQTCAWSSCHFPVNALRSNSPCGAAAWLSMLALAAAFVRRTDSEMGRQSD